MFRKFLQDESGQAATEYILVLGLVVGSVSLLFKGMIKALDQGVVYLGGALEKDLRTGRMDVSHWAE